MTTIDAMVYLLGMDMNDAATLARTLMDHHGLHGWTLRFDNAKRRLGVCRYGKREIGLSAPLVVLNDETVIRDTILHEIAHALTPGAGHGPAWRRMAASIGADPSRCADADAVVAPTGAWTGACPNDACDFTVDRYRLTDKAKRGACPECCRRLNGGRFSDAYRLIWRRNAA